MGGQAQQTTAVRGNVKRRSSRFSKPRRSPHRARSGLARPEQLPHFDGRRRVRALIPPTELVGVRRIAPELRHELLPISQAVELPLQSERPVQSCLCLIATPPRKALASGTMISMNSLRTSAKFASTCHVYRTTIIVRLLCSVSVACCVQNSWTARSFSRMPMSVIHCERARSATGWEGHALLCGSAALREHFNPFSESDLTCWSSPAMIYSGRLLSCTFLVAEIRSHSKM